ncbi:MAG: ATP-binding protein [Methanomassiliicoccaceae archaeon]|nr:ATP-binding protein [Methanomassiliicoccaceae archaeon]
MRPKPEPLFDNRSAGKRRDPLPALSNTSPPARPAPRAEPSPVRKITASAPAARPAPRAEPPPKRVASAPAAAPQPERKTVPIPKYSGPVTRPPASSAGNASDKKEGVGIIYGNVGTSTFNCRATAYIEKSEYIMTEHEDCGPVLCQVGSLIRKTDLSLEKTLDMNGSTSIQEIVSAQIDVVGYRDDRGLLQVPRTTFSAGKPVYRASDMLIQSVLGLKMKEKTGAYIGLLHGHGVPVYLDINDLLQRHVCILAKTGGGKSYVSGDIIEELMKHRVTCMIIDPHGEYSAMREVGVKGDPRFGVVPRGYADHINEFTISKNPDRHSRPLRFTLKTLEAREILELTRTNDIRSHLPPLRKAIDALRERQDAYSVRELIDVLSGEEENRNPMLITELEYLDEIGIFATRGNRVDELVEQGKTTIVNLKGVPPDIQELIVRRLGTLMFEMRKIGNIPPMMLIIEEAHNYCPQQGTAISSRALATIASEGRKFGLGLMVISQRPAKIDKNVLSQCGTQIILKVTNPNDVKAIAASVEGLTNGMTDDIQTMPIGIAMVVGAGIEAPLLIDVRPRESRHGGTGVKVLSEDDE